MAPVTMATVMKNKHSGINYFFLRQNKEESKKVSPKSVSMREINNHASWLQRIDKLTDKKFPHMV